MKAFIAAVIVAVGISVAASVVLERYQRTAEVAFSGSGARP